jgi:suppressor for copper-sensitivity B
VRCNIQYPLIIKIIIACVLLVFTTLNYTYANEGDEIRKFEAKIINNKLHFVIDLKDGYKVYAPYSSSKLGLPIKIDLTKSENLKSHKIIWPEPFSDGDSEYYTDLLSIPVHLEKDNTNNTAFVRADIFYLLCKTGCTPISQTIDYELQATEQDNINLMSILILIAFAVTGGAILNFMPCVLPVLSLKLLSITKNPDRSFGFTIAGIMTTFLSLAIFTIMMRNSGEQFGLGANFQKPEFIIALSIIVNIFISVASDRATIALPAKISNFLLNKKFKSEDASSFFNGVLASILSTPCTAPFLGTAMAFALTGSDFVILITFLSVGIGFSFPYLLLLTFPHLLEFLPKPGKWIVIFKKLLVLLLILTLGWLLSVVYSQVGGRATIGFIFLLVLIKFTIENVSSFEKKMLLMIVLLPTSFYLPKFAYNEDKEWQNQIDHVWQNFNRIQLDNYIAEGKTVFVDVTADWCVTCKYNKIMVLNQHRTLKLLEQTSTIALRADFTNRDPEIYKYLIENKVHGIPFNIVYGPRPPHVIILPVLLSYEDIKQAIEKLKL